MFRRAARTRIRIDAAFPPSGVLLGPCRKIRLDRRPHDFGRGAMFELLRIGMKVVPRICARYPNFAVRREFGRLIEACRLQKFNERRLWPADRYRGATFATVPSPHRPAAIRLHRIIFRLRASELEPVARHDQHRGVRTTACALTVAAMTDQLSKRLFAALISNAPTSASTRQFCCHRSFSNEIHENTLHYRLVSRLHKAAADQGTHSAHTARSRRRGDRLSAFYVHTTLQMLTTVLGTGPTGGAAIRSAAEGPTDAFSLCQGREELTPSCP